MPLLDHRLQSAGIQNALDSPTFEHTQNCRVDWMTIDSEWRSDLVLARHEDLPLRAYTRIAALWRSKVIDIDIDLRVIWRSRDSVDSS
jgi:hypothetical protein